MNYYEPRAEVDFLDYKPQKRVNHLDYTLTPKIQLELMKRLGRDTRVDIGKLEKLTEDVPPQVLADQLLVIDRVTSLIGDGFGSFVENMATWVYERTVSGGSRHSFCLMATYTRNPLEDYSLGRFDGSDFLNGREVDLFGDNKKAKEVLKRIRHEEGVGLLRINDGNYTFINSGVAFPYNNRSGEYHEGERRGMMVSSVLDFSKRYHSRSENLVWFFRLNNSLSLIQNGRVHDVDYK